MARNPEWLATAALVLLFLAPALAHAQDPGRSCATAVPLQVGVRVNGSVDSERPIYLFRVRLESSHVYVLDAQTFRQTFEASVEPAFVLREADCLAQVQPLPPRLDDLPVTFRPRATGEFVLEASAASGSGNLPSAFSIELTDRGPVADDYPDTAAGAPLAADEIVGSWEFNHDVDTVLVNLLAGRPYRFEFFRRVYNASGREIGASYDQRVQAARLGSDPVAFELFFLSEGTGEHVPCIAFIGAQVAGLYALTIAPPVIADTGQYTLRITDEGPRELTIQPGSPGSSCGNPMPLPLNDLPMLLRVDAGYASWFAIDARAGQTVRVRATPPGYPDPLMATDPPELDGVFAPGCGAKVTDLSEPRLGDSFLAGVDGTYLLRLRPSKRFAGTTFLGAVVLSEVSPPGPSDDFPDAPGSAPVVSLVGASIGVRADSYADIDCFIVQLSTGVHAVQVASGSRRRFVEASLETQGRFEVVRQFGASATIAVPPSSSGRVLLRTAWVDDRRRNFPAPVDTITFTRLDHAESLSRDCLAPTPILVGDPPAWFAQFAPAPPDDVFHVVFHVQAGHLYRPSIVLGGRVSTRDYLGIHVRPADTIQRTCPLERRSLAPFTPASDGPATLAFSVRGYNQFEELVPETDFYLSARVEDLGLSADRIGDTPETAMPINPDGFMIDSTIDHAGDVDAFAATLDPSANYRLEVQGLVPSVPVDLEIHPARPDFHPTDQPTGVISFGSSASMLFRADNSRAREVLFTVFSHTLDRTTPYPDPYRLRISRASCPADFGHDGFVSPDDLADFIAAFFSSSPDARADFNADGEIDPDDLAAFIEAYFAAC